MNEAHQPFVIGTDQNIDLLKHENNNVKKLVDLMYEHGLMPTISKPTRITKSTATLIDNIYVSRFFHKFNNSAILVMDTSDHYPCILNLGAMNTSETCKKTTFKGRNLCANSVNNLIRYLNNFNWDSLSLDCFSVNGALDHFMLVLNHGMDLHLPIKTITVSNRNVIRERWLTKSILRSNRKSQKLYMKWKQTDSLSDGIKYRNYRNTLNRLKRRAKIDYYNQYFVENFGNAKKSWKLLNSIIGRTSDKSSLPSYVEINSEKVFDLRKMSNEFNQYFGNLGKNYYKKIGKTSKSFEDYLVAPTSASLTLNVTTPNDVYKLIMSLKNKNSSGHDGLSNNFVKKIANGISYPLSIIINKSITSGLVPESFKLAEVSPLYKSGFHHILTNYHPISLLPVFSKILEKVVERQLRTHLESNDLLHKNQFGFCTNSSCQDCVMKLIHDIMPVKNQGSHAMSIFCDLSKAFDTLVPSQIIRKLRHYGVSEHSLEWFKSYFKNRTQIVCLKDVKSDPYVMEFGIGQGSILGPLIFLVQINDVYTITKYSTIIGFADDTTVYHCYHNLVTLYARLKYDMRQLLEWFKCNKLSLNATKTSFMLFTKNKCAGREVMQIDNVAINRCSETKLLGIMIDEKLNWEAHFSYLCKKLQGGIFALNSTRNILPSFIKLRLYYSFVYSHIQYGCEIWGSLIAKRNLNRLQIIQNNCIRNILRLKSRDSVRNNFVGLKMLPISEVFKLNRLKFMFRHENDLLPKSLSNMFSNVSHDYNTRQQRFNYTGKNTLLEVLVKDWNQLPTANKIIKSLSQFKKNIKYQMLSTL